MAPQNLARRACECFAGAVAMPESHAASFVSKEQRLGGYLAFSLSR
jgi:hypothetical protein